MSSSRRQPGEVEPDMVPLKLLLAASLRVLRAATLVSGLSLVLVSLALALGAQLMIASGAC